jgi:release factor glutamine methyltransferase
MLNPVKIADYKAGIIVSNPPYVRDSEKSLMNRNVIDFEPHQALFVPDSDPLVYYKAIALIGNKILNPGGMVYLEINEALDKEMLFLFDSEGYTGLKIIPDLSGKQRILKGVKNG